MIAALLEHPKWGGVPPKKLIVKMKFGLKFSVLESITSGLVGVSSRNFFQSTRREAEVITWVQFLEGPPQKNLLVQKIVLNFPRFLTTFDFDRELRKGSTYRYRKWEKRLTVYTPSTLKSLRYVVVNNSVFILS